MSNSTIIKLAGILAVVSMLFLPMAGCGTVTLSGLDIIKGNEFDSVVRILLIAAIIAGLGVILLSKRKQVLFSSIVGIILLVAAYIYMKSTLQSDNGDAASNSANSFFKMDAAEVIELKSGAYLALIGLLISAFVARSKKEIIAPQTVSNPPPDERRGNDPTTGTT